MRPSAFQGIPLARNGPGDRGAVATGRAMAEGCRCRTDRHFVPMNKYALPAYSSWRRPRRRPISPLLTACATACAFPGRDVIDCTSAPAPRASARKSAGRIMIGTYVLSAGYYDAYYLQAQKVRTLIKREFEKCFDEGIDAILTPATPSAAFAIGEKGRRRPDRNVSQRHIHGDREHGRTGRAFRLPIGYDAQGLPSGCIDRTAVRGSHPVRTRRGYRAGGGQL